jgi:phosphatidate cytidylyltransferase
MRRAIAVLVAWSLALPPTREWYRTHAEKHYLPNPLPHAGERTKCVEPMLKQRIVTASILLALLLAALFSSWQWPFTALSMCMVALAGWEWARLNSTASPTAWFWALILLLSCLLTWRLGGVGIEHQVGAWLATGMWTLGGAYALTAGPQTWPHLPRTIRLVFGTFILWAAWVAIASARVVGLNFLLSVFSLVWIADIAAYTGGKLGGGKLFGMRKLAPTISPGKSWEGACSGVLGVLLLALAWMACDGYFPSDSPSVFGLLAQRFGMLGSAFLLVFLSAMSIVGDLVESLVKRAAGVKDSSHLLPGHGGILDRIDALLPVFPMVMAFISW